MLDSLIETIDGYLLDGYTAILNLEEIPKILGLLFGGIIAILGTFQLIKKLTKLFIILGVIVAIAYGLNSAEIVDVPFI